jgi:methyl-accepting chemotaxis protein
MASARKVLACAAMSNLSTGPRRARRSKKTTMKTLKQFFGTALAAVALLVLLLAFAIFQTGRASDGLSDAYDTRFASLQLAGELRESSDNLTRLARTFVVSGDPMWAQQYQEAIDIRSGIKLRPVGDEKTRWDFRPDNMAPRVARQQGASSSVSWLERMRAGGYTRGELAKLAEVAANSDDLVKTETVAMNLVKGRYADGQGGFTQLDEPDLALARKLLHDDRYHAGKAEIMQPLNGFFSLLDARTNAAVTSAFERRNFWIGVTLVLAALLSAAALGSLWIARRWIASRLGAEPHVVVAVVRKVAQGNLALAIVNESRDPHSLMAELQGMVRGFSQSVTQVRSSAESVASASAQMAQGNNDLSYRTEQQASSLEETAASMEQLSATVTQNADNARKANQLAASASVVAQKGGEVVGQVVTTMDAINASSKKIRDIIGVIDGIAFQTNILALNAAVEAARAGEQGRGFAVVAAEVRSLAGRSADAAKEIKALIGASVARVEQGSALVNQAGSTMAEVVASIRRVTDIVREISATSAEQSSGVLQVGTAITQMDQATQQNAALVEESAAAADSLKIQSIQLVDAVAVFTLGLTGENQLATA